MTINNELYFKIKQNYILYIEPVISDDIEKELKENTPEIIKVIRNNYQKEQLLMQTIKSSEDNKEIAKYLEMQSKKIEQLIFMHIKENEKKGTRVEGLEFGGSHLTFNTDYKIKENQLFNAIILIENHLIAAYCIIKIIQVVSNKKQFQNFSKIECINAEDREKLIRSSLKQQVKVMKQNKIKEPE